MTEQKYSGMELARRKPYAFIWPCRSPEEDSRMSHSQYKWELLCYVRMKDSSPSFPPSQPFSV